MLEPTHDMNMTYASIIYMSLQLHMLKCTRHMYRLYHYLGDRDMEETQLKRCKQLDKEMGLHCAVCHMAIGDVPDTLELYSCFHIAHARSVCGDECF